MSDTQTEMLRLYREGLDLQAICARRGLKDSTISAQLEELADMGADVDLLRFVAADKIPLIQDRLAKVGPGSLSLLKEELPDSISYEDIRFVRGEWNRLRGLSQHDRTSGCMKGCGGHPEIFG